MAYLTSSHISKHLPTYAMFQAPRMCSRWPNKSDPWERKRETMWNAKGESAELSWAEMSELSK